MAGSKIIEFDAENLLDLLTHYTEGDVPLGARLLGLGVHNILNRHVGLYVEAKNWRDPMLKDQDAYAPLFIEYDGKRVMTWGTKDHQSMKFHENPE